MKRSLITLIAITAFNTSLYAQKYEFSVQINGNSSRFSGNGQDLEQKKDSKKGYGASVQLQHVRKSGMIVGLQTGYEVVRTATTLFDPTLMYFDFFMPSVSYYAYSQNAVFNNKFINVNPYIGYRLGKRDMTLDVTSGPELAILASGQTKVDVYNNGAESTRTTDRKQTSTDLRIKIGMAAAYKRVGINGSYAYGLTDYLKPYASGTYVYHQNIFRLGLSYRLN